jgi:quercetin dioxygenase-like cupin family protein
MPPVLRLCEDYLTDRGVLGVPPLPRMLYVVRGFITIDTRIIGAGEAWYGEGAVTAVAGDPGATLWRWELSSGVPALVPNGRGISSHEKLAAELDTLPEGELLWRGDSVAFPPGGVAYLHRHQGPGIRCVVEGRLRVDVNDHSNEYGIGGAWFEAGPDPVFAQAQDKPTRFIRVMILPRALTGKSSIRYVNEEDKAKPKAQQYKVFVDAPVARP